jgi:hypothetical protein
MASRSRNGKRGDARASVAEPPGFRSLSKAEQIRYLQALWDRISETPGELPVPTSHLRVAKERLARYRPTAGRDSRAERRVMRKATTREARAGSRQVKKRVLAAVEKLPADATIEDAIERLVLLAKIERGLTELDSGKGISHREAKRRLLR